MRTCRPACVVSRVWSVAQMRAFTTHIYARQIKFLVYVVTRWRSSFIKWSILYVSVGSHFIVHNTGVLSSEFEPVNQCLLTLAARPVSVGRTQLRRRELSTGTSRRQCKLLPQQSAVMRYRLAQFYSFHLNQRRQQGRPSSRDSDAERNPTNKICCQNDCPHLPVRVCRESECEFSRTSISCSRCINQTRSRRPLLCLKTPINCCIRDSSPDVR